MLKWWTYNINLYNGVSAAHADIPYTMIIGPTMHAEKKYSRKDVKNSCAALHNNYALHNYCNIADSHSVAKRNRMTYTVTVTVGYCVGSYVYSERQIVRAVFLPCSSSVVCEVCSRNFNRRDRG